MKKELITIKTLFGFEEILKEELQELGYKDIKTLNRAVQIEGTWEDVYRLNYRCRLAISVLVEIETFYIHKERDVYTQALKIDWPSYFDIDKTFAVKGAVFSNLFKHTQFPMLLIKDAIADSFRNKFDRRPDVNVRAPQVMFDVYIKDKAVTISLNTSGVPLFQRGYRQETGEAPMNEVLAAGILRLSGWDRKSTLIDPMCGAGTIAIEAALWAADIPAMIERTHYAFKNFKTYQPELWEKVRQEGNHRPVDLGFEILAYDIDGEMVQKARRNSRVAPIGNMISFERKDFLSLDPFEGGGTVICNPPYGERIGEEEEIIEFYEKIGDTFKQSFKGFNCWIISSNIDALKNVGLKTSSRIKVFNGNLECSFRQYPVFEGSYKELKKRENEDGEEIGQDDVSSPKSERTTSIRRPRRVEEEKPARRARATRTETPPVKEEPRREREESPRKETERPVRPKPASRASSGGKYSFSTPTPAPAIETETLKQEKVEESIEEKPVEVAETKSETKEVQASKYTQYDEPVTKPDSEIEASTEEVTEVEETKTIKEDKVETEVQQSKYTQYEEPTSTADSEIETSDEEPLSLKEKIERMKRKRK